MFRIFDYALGLASQLKVNVSYSEVVISWIETLIYVLTLKILLSFGQQQAQQYCVEKLHHAQPDDVNLIGLF